MVKLSKGKFNKGKNKNTIGNCGQGNLIGSTKAGCPPSQSTFSRSRCSQGLRGPRGKRGATGLGNTWYINTSCDTPADPKRDPICGDQLLNTSNCEICTYGSTGWEPSGQFLNCATDCDAIVDCLLDLPRPEDTCVFTLQVPSSDDIFQQLGGVSILKITINDEDQFPIPINTFVTPADLAMLLQPFGWQWIPAGQTNLYINQFTVVGDPTAMGVDNSFTFSHNNKNIELSVQCQSDQCDPCQGQIEDGEILLLKNDELMWVNSQCICPTGKGACAPDDIIDVICNDIPVPEVSCEYCGYLDPDCFDFLNDLDEASTQYKVATTKGDGTIVLGPEDFEDDADLLNALNALHIIRIGDSLLKVTYSPEPIMFITFYNNACTPIANVKLAEFNCCPTGIDQDTKVLSKIDGGLAWVNADCLIKDDINLTEKILGLPQCQEYKCTIIFDVCEPFNKNNLNFPWEFTKFTVLGADQAHYIGKPINSPQDVFELLETDPINDWSPVCPTGSCQYQLCVFSDTPAPEEESCYSLEDMTGHIFINKDMDVDCHAFEDQNFQIIVSGSKDGVFLCDADDIIKDSINDLPCISVPTGATCGAIVETGLKVLAMGETSCYWIPHECVGGGVCACECTGCPTGGNGGGNGNGDCSPPCDLSGIPCCEIDPKFDIKIVVKKDLIDIINCHFTNNQPYWIANFKLADGGTIDACQPIEEPFDLQSLAKAFEDLGWIVVPQSCNVTSQTDEICIFKDNSCDEIVSVCINILGNKGEQLPISFPIPVFCLTNVGCTGLYDDCKVLIRGPEPGDFCFVDKQCLMPTPQINLPKELCKLGECDSETLYKVCLCLDNCDIEKLITIFGGNAVLKILHYELVGGDIKPVNRGLPGANMEDLVDALLAEGWGISSGSVENLPITMEICGPYNIQYVGIHDNSSILVAPYPVLLGVTCTVFKNCESQNPENMILVKKPDNEICWTPICPSGEEGKQTSPVSNKHFSFDRRYNQAPGATLGAPVRLVYPQCPGDTQAEISHLICDGFEWGARVGGTGTSDQNEGSVATDNLGNVYMALQNNGGDVDFFNYDGSLAFTKSDHASGIYVGKISPRGIWIWAASVNAEDEQDLTQPNIDLDSNNNLYVSFEVYENNGLTGLTFVNQDESTFNQSFAANPERDLFVAKLNTSNGTWQWDGAASVNSINSEASEEYERNNDLSVDCQNNFVNVVGTTDRELLYFFNSGNTGASPDLMLDGPTGSTGIFDIFAASVNENGDWRWRARVGFPTTFSPGAGVVDLNEVRPKISTDCHGNSYIVGQAETVHLEFFSDPDNQINPILDNNTNFVSSGLTGPFIFWSKISQNGIWHITKIAQTKTVVFGPTGNSNLTAPDVVADCDGNTYLTGIFNNINIFYPGISEYHSGLTAGNFSALFANNDNEFPDSDFFVIKTDNDGSGKFAAKIGGASDESMGTVAVDSQGDAYVAMVSTSDQVRFYNERDAPPAFFRPNLSTITDGYMVVVAHVSSEGAWDDEATLLVTNAIDPQLAVDCDDNLFLTVTLIGDANNPSKFINSDMGEALCIQLDEDDDRDSVTVKIARDQVAQTLGFLTSLPDLDNRVTAEFPGKQVNIPGQNLVPANNYYLDCNGLTSNCCCGARFMGTACSVREIIMHSGRPCSKCNCKP